VIVVQTCVFIDLNAQKTQSEIRPTFNLLIRSCNSPKHLCFLCIYRATEAVRKNPLARNTTRRTYQLVTAKWLFGARDRNGGHKERVLAAIQKRQNNQ